MQVNKGDVKGEEIVFDRDASFTKGNALWQFIAHSPRKVLDRDILEKALQNGANYVHEAPPPPPEPEPEPEVEEEDPLVAALEGLIEEGDPENFKKDGTPKSAVINKLAGKAVTTEERETAWQTALNR